MVLSKTQFSHPSSWSPHRFESEDHTIPWFCPKLSFLIQVVGFPIRLSLRTIQYPGSVQNSVLSSKTQFYHPSSWFPHRFESEDHTIHWFCPKLSFLIQVVRFPISLSPRTIQYLGSVQNSVLISSWGNYPLSYGVGPWFKGTSSSAKPLEPSVLLTL